MITIKDIDYPTCCGECMFSSRVITGGGVGLTCELKNRMKHAGYHFDLDFNDIWGVNKDFKFADCPISLRDENIGYNEIK